MEREYLWQQVSKNILQGIFVSVACAGTGFRSNTVRKQINYHVEGTIHVQPVIYMSKRVTNAVLAGMFRDFWMIQKKQYAFP